MSEGDTKPVLEWVLDAGGQEYPNEEVHLEDIHSGWCLQPWMKTSRKMKLKEKDEGTCVETRERVAQ